MKKRIVLLSSNWDILRIGLWRKLEEDGYIIILWPNAEKIKQRDFDLLVLGGSLINQHDGAALAASLQKEGKKVILLGAHTYEDIPYVQTGDSGFEQKLEEMIRGVLEGCEHM